MLQSVRCPFPASVEGRATELVSSANPVCGPFSRHGRHCSHAASRLDRDSIVKAKSEPCLRIPCLPAFCLPRGTSLWANWYHNQTGLLAVVYHFLSKLLFLGQPQGSGVFIMFILAMEDQKRDGNRHEGALNTHKPRCVWVSGSAMVLVFTNPSSFI